MDAHSVFEPDESGRVLDRLAGLEQVISPELIEQALLETETKNKRRCKAPHVTMLWVVLAMGLFTGEPIEQLSDGSYLARIGPKKGSNRYRERHGIVVRIVKYTIDDPQRTGHQEVHRLLTTLLDEQEHPAAELITLYHERWEQETGYDEQKTHQDPRRASKPTHLRSQTPAGVVQELYGLSLAHYAVCQVKFDAAVSAGVDPDRISFTGTIQVLRCRLPECSTPTPQTIDDWYENLVSDVARQKLPPRSGRINPRAVRTNRKKWNMKKPDDYARPPLTKTFPETIVILS